MSGEREVAALLGAVVWPRLAASFIEHRLSPAVPEDDSQLERFQRICRSAQRFEAQAASLGYGLPTMTSAAKSRKG